MKNIISILSIILIIVFSGCTYQSKFEKAKRKIEQYTTDYPQLLKTDSVTVVQVDTFYIEKDAKAAFTPSELDSFIVDMDTIRSKPKTPENAKKEKVIKKRILDRCTLEGILGWNHYHEKFDSCDVEIIVVGNKLKAKGKVHQFTKTISEHFVPAKISYLGHLKEVWHIPALLLLITTLLILERRPRA